MPHPPRPVAVKRNTVHHETPGQAPRTRIVMSDGSTVQCEHEYGHQAEESFKRCAGQLRKQLTQLAEDGAP